jgi:hypothetical protein
MRLDTIGLVFVLTLVSVAAEAQTLPRGLWRVEAGTAEFHVSRGVFVGARVARTWHNDLLRLDAGILAGSGDEGFFAVDAGPELRLCSAPCRVAPFLGVTMGVLREPRFGTAGISRAGGGVEIAVGARNLLRVGLYRGKHGSGQLSAGRGPHIITIGYGRRL